MPARILTIRFKSFLIILALLMGLTSCSGGSNSGGETPPGSASTSTNEGEDRGMKLYTKYCVNCHGAAGDLQFSGAADLTVSDLGKEERMEIVANGKGVMNGFKNMLSEEDIELVVEYAMTLRK